uniref:Serine-threonine/tyrosine-protein kinase catalytic domain-containing protein n=1 Tax=Ananas comosus var. bracteatus TaxID=296719 RepID=A0A6V7PL95_ANACO|nr:unnamed protein product [Ananas comosus var. bracteatus]
MRSCLAQVNETLSPISPKPFRPSTTSARLRASHAAATSARRPLLPSRDLLTQAASPWPILPSRDYHRGRRSPSGTRPSSWYGTRWVAAVSRPSSLRPCRPSSWYGIVYRGVLADHSVAAVKYLLDNKGQAEKEFKVEVKVIGKVRHKNLVGLIGYCAEGTKRTERRKSRQCPFLELFKLFGNSSRSKGRQSPQSTKP